VRLKPQTPSFLPGLTITIVIGGYTDNLAFIRAVRLAYADVPSFHLVSATRTITMISGQGGVVDLTEHLHAIPESSLAGTNGARARILAWNMLAVKSPTYNIEKD